MSREFAASVPGKTILLGEHAAVYGHPALVTALDHRMTVTLRRTSGSSVHLAMPGIGYAGSPSWDEILARTAGARERWSEAFEHGDGSTFRPVREPHQLALIALGEAALETAPEELHGLDVRVDSRIPPRSGFGSSAALAVAVSSVTMRALGAEPSDAAIERVALAVERSQHGRPSGVDVEAVLRGGVLWCRRAPSGELEHEALLPSGAALAAIRLFHSGAPRETTGEMVSAVRRLADREPARVRAAMEAIESATREGRAAIERGDAAAFVPIVRRAEEALESLEVVPGGVRSAIRAIEAQGGAAKISGAGGATGAGAGLVLVVHPDPDWHARFTTPGGWIADPVSLGAAGLREEVPA